MRPAQKFVHIGALALLLVAGCAGSQAPPPSDPTLDSEWRLARFALQEGQYYQAVALYEQALSRAHARDDVAAIGDIGYEYALALLRNGTPRLAAEQARKTRQELERRDAPVFAELFLLEAVARYESEEPALARAAADASIRRADAEDNGTRARAQYVIGMLAADTGDADQVEQALLAMGQPRHGALQADRKELQGRWLLMTGDGAGAGLAFDDAAWIRQDLGDYGGMAKAMAGGAAAAEMTGDVMAAADLYYRAGRSAAVQKDADQARAWLTQALDLAVGNQLSTIEAESREQLQALDQ